MTYPTSQNVIRRAVGVLCGGVLTTGAVVLALSQTTGAQTPHPAPAPSSQTSVAPHGFQHTHPARQRPAPSPASPVLGGFASPSRCIEINGGDWNACNVGNSGRGDLPYRVVRAGRS